MVRYAGVEAGGTTFVVAIAEDHPSNIVERVVFDTTTPREVIQKVVDWLSTRQFDALGVGSFGPIDLREGSDSYGFITETPKTLWRHTDLLGPIVEGLKLPPSFPVGFDTDVNAPAMMEYAEANANGANISSCVYVTVGTGLGIGMVFNGHPIHGLLHGEGGHMSVARYKGDTFQGKKSLGCDVWDELESMVNTAAIAGRVGCEKNELQDLPDEHPVWDIVAHYLAVMCTNLILLVSPERIVLSGGVLKRSILFPMIRAKTQKYLNNYIQVDQVTKDIDQLIVQSKYRNKAGIIGSLHLARLAMQSNFETPPPPSPVKRSFAIAYAALAGAIAGFIIAKRLT